MRIELSNINRIRRASIKLNGLTIIAGENDTGKSTLSKMIFSNIKAYANVVNDGKISKAERIEPSVRQLYKRIGMPLRRNPYGAFLRTKIPNSAEEFIDEIYSLNNDEIGFFLKEFTSKLEGWDSIKLSTKALIEKDLQSIEICLKNSDNPAALLQPKVRRLIESEFFNKITSIKTEQSKFAFIDDHNRSIMSYEITEGTVNSLHYNDTFNFYNDATYVESPLHFQLQDVIKRAQTYIEMERGRNSWSFRNLMVPMHVKDFSDKISTLAEDSDSADFPTKTVYQIHETTKGAFIFDKNKRRIMFKNGLGEFSLNNVASGIKSFGVLEILLSNEIISPEKMLLWDEPENHLHPQWQVHFAEILVQLTKAGIPIVVCSHSPYFIQAIRHFSSVYSIEESVDYYLSRIEDDGLCTFDEVTTDLNRIFSKLAAPMNKIMNFG